MKKIISISIIILSGVLFSAFHTNQELNNTIATFLLLKNIEAIAGNESSGKECPGGSSECAKVDTGDGIHTFYQK